MCHVLGIRQTGKCGDCPKGTNDEKASDTYREQHPSLFALCIMHCKVLSRLLFYLIPPACDAV